VWAPRAVAVTWRPYQVGHWVWTDDGWLWVSDEPYGWATYHYAAGMTIPTTAGCGCPARSGDRLGLLQAADDYVGWAPCSVGLLPGRATFGLPGARNLRLRAVAPVPGPTPLPLRGPDPGNVTIYRRTRNSPTTRSSTSGSSTGVCRWSRSSASSPPGAALPGGGDEREPAPSGRRSADHGNRVTIFRRRCRKRRWRHRLNGRSPSAPC